MERKENKPQASGICYRLFNFIVDGLLFRGLKRVTLGRPVESNMVSGRSSNTAGHNEGYCVGATKPTAESGIHNLAYGASDTKESLVERANKLYKSFPVATMGSSILVQKNGIDGVSDDEFLEVQPPSLRVITVGGTLNRVKGVTASPINSQGRNSVRFEQPSIQDSQMVEDPSSSSQITSSQNVLAQGGAKGEMEKKKGKEASNKGKQILFPVMGNDVKVRATTPVIPIITHAFDIDQRSDELIRRTREALRNSARQS